MFLGKTPISDGITLFKQTYEIDIDFGNWYTIYQHEEVGHWYRSNGTIIFDEGRFHDEFIIIEFEIHTYPLDPSQP